MVGSQHWTLKGSTVVALLCAIALMSSCSFSPSSNHHPTLVSIAVSAPSLSMAKGTSEQFTATGTYSDQTTRNLTSSVSWISQNTGVATVTAVGSVTAAGAGTSTIQAVSGSVVGSATLTVTSSTLVSIAVTASSLSIANGTTAQFTATGTFSDNSMQNLTNSVTWGSQSVNVAMITAGGLAMGLTPGTTKIQATSGSVSGFATLTVTSATLVSIAVTAPNFSIAKGTSEQFSATGTYSDGSTQNITGSVSWSSQNTGMVTITAGGLATAVAAGSSKIQAALGPTSGSATLTVTPATLVSIAVSATNLSITKGTSEQLTATGTYSDGSTQNITGSVTWSSQNTSVATITTGGMVTAAGTGMSSIKAVSGTISGSATLTVTAATLVSIVVTAPIYSITKGTSEPFNATGTYSDGTTQNITGSVTWSSQNTSVATITTGGIVTATGTGMSSIKAVSGTISGSATLTVTPATLVSIVVAATSLSITKGTSEQFTATGTYSDGTTQNITSSVTWSSQTMSVATITAAGMVTAVGAGMSSIKAVSGAISGSSNLTVTAATLVSIAVTPANPTIATTGTEQFTSTGTYSDNSTQNLTTTVTWSSSHTNIATISNTAGANGLATAVANGATTIQAALGSVQGSTTLTVSAVSLQVVVVSPQNPSIADNGVTQAFTATGHYSDGSMQNLTATASWTSSNSGAASVNASGVATSATLASGVSAAFTSIQAAVGSTKGVSILTVTNHTTNSIGFAGVFTQHNDIARTGQNLSESVLTPTNVNTTSFGKLFSQTVDGYIYAQPLYVPNVTIAGSTHNVIYVATEGDSVYAFDADSNTGTNAGLLWHANLIDTAHGASSGATTVNVQAQGGKFANCTDLVPQVGITSTPVIDPSNGTMYVETKSEENGNFIHRLHAIDITTGAEKSPGPVQITATVPGTGDGGTTVTLDGLYHLNRPGLLLLNGSIYVAYASHCDTWPYHGWLFAYNASTLTQTSLFVTTPNGSVDSTLGGFWMSGAGVAADSNANIFIASGNGLFDTVNVPTQELGDTIMKLFNTDNPRLSLEDYFTPSNQSTLDEGDTDVGSGGVLLLPDQPGGITHELVEAGKEGTIFVINRDQMTAGNLHYCQTGCDNGDPQITQEIQGKIGGLWSAPAYFNGVVYFCGVGMNGDNLKAFPLSNGLLATSPSELSGHVFQFPGCTPAASANGNANGIIWAVDTSTYGVAGPSLGPAVLYAFQAGTLSPLWNSTEVAGDMAGDAVKFAVPTIANGKVYLGTQTELDVYGTH